jgi:hypothetical protein
MTLFENKQWVVTADGIQAKPMKLHAHVSPSDLLREDETDGERMYGWPPAMARQSWVDIVLFCEAFLFALGHFHAAAFERGKATRALHEAYSHRIRELEAELSDTASDEPRPLAIINVWGDDEDPTERWRAQRYGYPTTA